MMKKFDERSLPEHVAIVMDGNRRWARQHGLEVLRGHEYVANKVIEPLVDACLEKRIPYLTLWAFSTENWRRERDEVEGLMQIFRQAFSRSGEMLARKGVRLRVIGDMSKFPQDIQDGVAAWVQQTAGNAAMTVTFALNYGGRDEIVRAVNRWLAHPDHASQIRAEDIHAGLDTADMPDPDLIIRPGGEKRLSGYLLWQSEYAELYFTEVLMPNFSPAELDKALDNYAARKRNFGK